MAGIFPFRDDIFTDADFPACEALDRPAVFDMTDAGPATSCAVVVQTSSSIVSGIDLDAGSVVDPDQLSATPNAVDGPDTSSIGTPSAVVLLASNRTLALPSNLDARLQSQMLLLCPALNCAVA